MVGAIIPSARVFKSFTSPAVSSSGAGVGVGSGEGSGEGVGLGA